jgi:dihydrofolate reductase
MRSLFMFNLVSLDGYFEGPGRDISWHNVDTEFNDYAVSMLDSVDTLLFGRVTYELMAGFWPTPEAMKNDPLVATRMNSLSKIVFSRTLDRADWRNTRLVKNGIGETVWELKQQPGMDVALLGSGSIVAALAQQGLIDEFRIMVNPVVLGRGTPLFKGVSSRLDLKLAETRAFKSGNVLLRYEPARRSGRS